MSSRWKKIRHRAEFFLVQTASALFPRLPRPLGRWLGNFIGLIVNQIDREGRQVALSNLVCAFGDELSPRERRRLVRHSYQHFSRAAADLYWSPRLTSQNLHSVFDLADLARVEKEYGKRGLIFACLHYGGFELISLALGLSGFECTVVTQAFKNPLLTGPINQLRETGGYQTVRREGALLRLYKSLVAGRNVAFAVDLRVSPRFPSVPITSFGMQTSVTLSHAWLHQRTQAPIIPTHCEPLPHGRYRLVLHSALKISPNDTEQEIAQACWDAFEPVVRQKPAPWLWMYKHWRYLPPNPGRGYPDYAKESSHFNRLLARAQR